MNNNDKAVLFTAGTIIFISLLGVMTRLFYLDMRVLFAFQGFLMVVAGIYNWYLFFTDPACLTPFTWMHRSKYMVLYYLAGVIYTFQLGYLISRY